MDDPSAPVRLCSSAELVEKGRALLWDVLQWREPARAFALRHNGRVVAYLNRCAHVPAEMDWLPGEFLDSRREFILCAIHGASYDTWTGRCIGGPCAGSKLIALRVEERGGEVYWYPSRNTRPLAEDATVAHESPT
jgi:nitrite reductase/ring-hydroxylating ferredoxin subunit